MHESSSPLNATEEDLSIASCRPIMHRRPSQESFNGEVPRSTSSAAACVDKLGLNYPLRDTEPPSEELTERVRGQFRSRGLTVY
jgi:hypothetical protein